MLQQQYTCCPRIGQDLTLTSNHLTALPDCICDMTRLVRLTVDSNYLEKLPQNIGNLQRLKYLSCGRNRITHIPRSIVRLRALKSLIMYQNRLGDRGVPDCICDMEVRVFIAHTIVRVTSTSSSSKTSMSMRINR